MTEYDRLNAELRAASLRSSMRSTREITSELAGRAHAAREQDPGRRRQQPTVQETIAARREAAASAWADARRRTANWPEALRQRELEEIANLHGAEPSDGGRAATDRQAAALLNQIPSVAERERGPVSPATEEAARRLLAGTQSAESEAHGRRIVSGR